MSGSNRVRATEVGTKSPEYTLRLPGIRYYAPGSALLSPGDHRPVLKVRFHLMEH